MKVFKFLILFLFLGLCSCVTNPYFVLKNHHFDTSETRGEKLKFSASLGAYQDVTTAVATVNTAAADPTLERWELVKNDEDGGGRELASGLDHTSLLFALSLHERLDISLDFPVGDQPTFFTMKYQIVGPTRLQAPEGSFSAAVFAGAGLIANESDHFDILGYTDESSVQGQAFRGGVSVGLRTSKELLVYWSNSYTKFFTEMEYIRNSGGTDNQTNFKFDGSQFLTMVGAQYIFAERVVANLEYGFVFADSDETEQERFTSLGFNIGYLF